MVSACAMPVAPAASARSACPSSSSKKTAGARSQRRTVSCRATSGGASDNGNLWLPRREMLSGVAAGLVWFPGVASGASASPCMNADPVNQKTLLCTDTAQHPCPLVSSAGPVDFQREGQVKRVRQAAHLLSPEYQAKYRLAVQRMKDLPDENPLSFKSQAVIHEAYCDSFYSYLRQSTADNPPFDVHYSWLFAPWHRMYIYFYERALGDLIGDDTFALPYWNWDHPAGMAIPAVFKQQSTDEKNPLFDANRNQDHTDALVNLDYVNNRDYDNIPFAGPKDEKYMELVNKNLCTVYTQQVKQGNGPISFLGDKYCTALGSSGTSSGTLERMAHTAMHVWAGKSHEPWTECRAGSGGFPDHQGGYNCNNDMGFLGSAGFDPLFYSHHSNVDRMWHVWSTTLGGKDLTDAEWMDTSFVFWDDVRNPKKVRIAFRDVLDSRNLGYTYDRESTRDLPWLRCNITSLVPHGKGSQPKASKAAAGTKFPLNLKETVEVAGVAVPAKEAGKDDQVLVIEGIEYDPTVNNKFDVAINLPAVRAAELGPQHTEYAGSFAIVPGTGGGKGKKSLGKVSLCISEVLKDMEAHEDTTVNIVIVPRTTAKVKLTTRPTIHNRQRYVSILKPGYQRTDGVKATSGNGLDTDANTTIAHGVTPKAEAASG